MSESRKLANYVISVPNGCWVDLYSGTYFAGRLKRIYGPGRIRVARIGSLIVGPEAWVVPTGRGRGVNLRPFRSRRIIPDLDTLWRKGKLKSLKVVRVNRGPIDHL